MVAFVVLAAACSSEEGENGGDAESAAVLASVAGEAGTELRDGFEVAAGSTLVGVVLPDGFATLGEPASSADDWWALLFVSGDPTEVMEAYLVQAEAAGMERVVPPDGSPELLREDLPAEAQRHTTCGEASEGGPAGFSCSGLAVTDGSAPCLRLNLVRRTVGRLVESSLQIRHATDPDRCVAAGFGMIGDPDAEVPSLPEPWPSPPSVGQPMGEEFGLLAPLRVVEGSAMAAPPFTGECFDGSSAILAVTGDPVAVLEAYLVQLDDLAPHSERTAIQKRTLETGQVVHSVGRVEPGGGDAFIGRVVEQGGDPALLVLTGCSG